MIAHDLHEKYRTKKASPAEVVRETLAAAEKENKRLNAFLTLNKEEALTAAKESEERYAKGKALGPLDGIPIAVKDNILTKGLRTTAGSKILEHFTPPEDATVIRKLRAKGAIVIGKTNLDEFAMGSSTENSAYGVTKNPRDTSRVPGGSSGGSGAAVAADLVPVALGSDTGGSVRQPGAFCGVVGFKPTYGAVSRYGLIAMASSLDVIGPFGNSVADVRTVFDVIAGKDPLDATSHEVTKGRPPVLRTSRSGGSNEGAKSLRGVKIGVPREYFGKGIEPGVQKAVRAAIDAMKKAGARVKDISLPHTEYALPVYYIIMPAEVSSNLARYDGIRYGLSLDASSLLEVYEKTRAAGFGAEVKRRIMLGTYTLSAGYFEAYYKKAMQVRTLVVRDFDSAFRKVDVIVTPTTPTVAFKFGERTKDPLAMYLSDIYTVSANVAGLPAISVPCGQGGGLPVGLQFMGKQGDDYRVLDVAEGYESLR